MRTRGWFREHATHSYLDENIGRDLWKEKEPGIREVSEMVH